MSQLMVSICWNPGEVGSPASAGMDLLVRPEEAGKQPQLPSPMSLCRLQCMAQFRGETSLLKRSGLEDLVGPASSPGGWCPRGGRSRRGHGPACELLLGPEARELGGCAPARPVRPPQSSTAPACCRRRCHLSPPLSSLRDCLRCSDALHRPRRPPDTFGGPAEGGEANLVKDPSSSIMRVHLQTPSFLDIFPQLLRRRYFSFILKTKTWT